MARSVTLDDTTAGTVQIGDRRVRRLGFGAMRLTGRGVWGEPEDPDGARAVLRRVVELGVNFIDTADSYGPEVSERLIAEALHPYPDDLVIATKGGFERSGPDRWQANGRPEHLQAACAGSLTRLRVESIDLYQLHTVDRAVPYEESVGALKDLQAQGKVRSIGVSNVDLERLATARGVAEVVSVQNRYNLLSRRHQPVLDACERDEVAFIPFFPLAAADLATPDGPLDGLARRHDATPAQIALAWLLHRSPVMLPIPGTSSLAHLEENVAAASIQLTDQDLTELERV